VILLYDNDEKVAPAAATTLVQRGYDNIFMLSGGEYFTFSRFTASKVSWRGLLLLGLYNFEYSLRLFSFRNMLFFVITCKI